MGNAIDVLGTEELAAGLKFGLVGLAVAAAAGLAWRSKERGPLPLAGLLFCAAGVAGLATVGTKFRQVDGLLAGLVLLVVGGAAVDARPRLLRLLPMLSLPGAWLVTSPHGDAFTTGWIRVLAMVTIVVGGWLVASFDLRWSLEAFAPGLFTMAVLGAYVTVPDTRRILVLVGVALPLALSAWPVPLAGFGAAGALGATGLLVWASVLDGSARPSSIVGALASLGILAAEPLARRLKPSIPTLLDRLPDEWWAAMPVAGLQIVVVYVAARVGGLSTSVATAAVIAVIDLAVAAVVLAVAAPSPPGAGHHLR